MDQTIIEQLYGQCTVYGPYVNPHNNGRQHVVLFYGEQGSNKTVSYPKLLMEIHLGKKIEEPDTVDHIDGNHSNNNIENLRVVTRGINSRTGQNQFKEEEYYHFTCPVCEQPAQIKFRYYKNNQIKQGKKGPFCGRSCARQFQLDNE